jgi:hypothetical protein
MKNEGDATGYSFEELVDGIDELAHWMRHAPDVPQGAIPILEAIAGHCKELNKLFEPVKRHDVAEPPPRPQLVAHSLVRRYYTARVVDPC